MEWMIKNGKNVDDAVCNLCIAIIHSAQKDFTRAYKRYKRGLTATGKGSLLEYSTMEEIFRFFNSKNGKILCLCQNDEAWKSLLCICREKYGTLDFRFPQIGERFPIFSLRNI